MKQGKRCVSGSVVAAISGLFLTSVATSGEIEKADNQDALSADSSWAGGVAPGTSDTAVWDGTIASSKNWTYGLGANTAWHGLFITNSVSMLTITNDGSTLTLGAGGVFFPAPTNAAYTCNIFSPVQVSENQAWNIGNAPLYQWGPVSGEGKLTLLGAAYAFYDSIALPAGLNVSCWLMHLRKDAGVTGPISVSPNCNLWLNKAVDTDWSDTFTGHSLTNNGIFDFGSGGTGVAHVTVTLKDGDQLVTTSNSDRNVGRINVVNNNVVQDGGYLAANWFYVTSGCVTQKQGTTFVDYAMYAGYGAPSELSNRCVQVDGGTLDVRRLHIGAANTENAPGIVNITGGEVLATRYNDFKATGVELAAAKTEVETGYSSAPAGVLAVSGGTLRTMQISFGSTVYPRDSTWNMTNGYARFDLKGGNVTVGAAGMGPSDVWNRTTNIPPDTAQAWYEVNLSGGTLGAYASYTNRALTRLSDANGGVTIRAADTNGTPYTITMSQPLTGRGSLRKTGAGTLALAAANTFTGATVVAAGTLQMVATSLWSEVSATPLPEAYGVWTTDNLTGAAGSAVTAWWNTSNKWVFNKTIADAIGGQIGFTFTSPTIGANLMNGHRVVSFNGAANALGMTGGSEEVGTPTSYASNLTVAVVMRSDRAGRGTVGYFRNASGIIGQDFYVAYQDYWGIAFTGDGRAGGGIVASNVANNVWAPPRNLNDGEAHVLTFVWQGASNIVMNVDGFVTAYYTNSLGGTRVKSRLLLGANENKYCFKGDIAEIRFYRQAFTLDQQRALGLELAKKYGAEMAGHLADEQRSLGSLASSDVRINTGAVFQTAAVGTRVRPGQVFRGCGSVGGLLVVGTNGVVQTTAEEALGVNALRFEPGGVYKWEYTPGGVSKALVIGDLTLPQGPVTVDIDAADENAAPCGVLMRYTGTLTDNGVTWRFLGGRGSTRVMNDTGNKLLYLSTSTGMLISVK